MRKFCVSACLLALSLAIPAPAQNGDKEKIEALYQAYLKAFNAKDVHTIMAMYDPNELFVFDVVPPREYAGWEPYKKDWEGLFAAFPGPLEQRISEQAITVVGALAYTRWIQSGYFTTQDGSRLDVAVRVTDVLHKVKGKWLIVQEHVSVPVDLATGKADLLSKP
jgi:ketosteroid isomerase-like protein